jgi:hypothetical protein
MNGQNRPLIKPKRRLVSNIATIVRFWRSLYYTRASASVCKRVRTMKLLFYTMWSYICVCVVYITLYTRIYTSNIYTRVYVSITPEPEKSRWNLVAKET